MTIRSILVCSVGGSPAPIESTIEQLQPDFVTFLCSGRDQATGQAGSDRQVLGTADNPGIPARLGWPEERYEVVLVDTDDLDSAFLAIRKTLSALQQWAPEAEITANYTGGTKTMSVALALAAVETDTVNLQMTTAPRIDCVKVHAGEEPVEAGLDSVRLLRRLDPVAKTWRRYDYHGACALLQATTAPRDARLRAVRARVAALSEGFAAWDDLCYERALAVLTPWKNILDRFEPGLFIALESLVRSPANEAAFRMDLWRNAERRACQKKFAEALGRIAPGNGTLGAFRRAVSESEWREASEAFARDLLPDLLHHQGLAVAPPQLPDQFFGFMASSDYPG